MLQEYLVPALWQMCCEDYYVNQWRLVTINEQQKGETTSNIIRYKTKTRQTSGTSKTLFKNIGAEGGILQQQTYS